MMKPLARWALALLFAGTLLFTLSACAQLGLEDDDDPDPAACAAGFALFHSCTQQSGANCDGAYLAAAALCGGGGGGSGGGGGGGY